MYVCIHYITCHDLNKAHHTRVHARTHKNNNNNQWLHLFLGSSTPVEGIEAQIQNLNPKP